MDMEVIGETRMKEIRRCLEKLEESVFKKKSGRCARMHVFYAKYEMAIYTTIVKVRRQDSKSLTFSTQHAPCSFLDARLNLPHPSLQHFRASK